MISTLIDATIITFATTMVLGVALRPKASTRLREVGAVAPILSVGLILGLGAMAALAPSFYPLAAVIVGALVLFAVGLASDFHGAATRRHFLGTMAAAVLLFAADVRISFFGIPFMGTVAVGPVLSLLLTLAYVFLVMSLLEIAALLPLAAGFVAAVLALGTVSPLAVYETPHGFALAGAILGAVLGRSLSNLVLARSRPLEKSEVLVLGYIVAAMTLSTYLKSVTLSSFVIPVGVVAIAVIILFTQSLDKSLILRRQPRE